MATLGKIIFYSMVTLIVLFSALIILILAVTLAGVTFRIKSANKTPVGNLGKEQLLSCFLNTDSDQINDMSVTWVKTGSTGIVHQYSEGVEDLSDQDSRYIGRTRLFQDSLLQGNGSLLLRGLRRSDEGEYRCSIESSEGSGDITIHLRTGAYSAPTFTFASGVLKAEAARWFPKPEVTWTDSAENILKAETDMSENSEGIFSFTSRLKEVNSSSTYYCNVQNQLVKSVSEAILTGTGVQDNSYFIFSSATSQLVSHLSLTAALLCLAYVT
ncbi:V-set domain-containing T-cell activation inhibitor 1 [Synchiropus splendidus]|uniref:V-set domain-containing T-cell activation inhibitor 1 n=1 Tax=Synchiropus splendidus TaxID=270530 RepID=UPI00237E0839|nr:V-set domain-containing T-cell activation inhibitor 1 [Synchiropus splendidus]